jgi:RNA polymerase sigma factor (TIGR02999 family)
LTRLAVRARLGGVTTQDLAALLPAPASADIALLRDLDQSVYAELMKLARSHLGRSATLSLDAPSLVHEAYLRLAQQGAIATAQRKTFFAYASRVMRTVIVDYVRERHAQKRGGGSAMVTLTTGVPGVSLDEDAIGALHAALKSLEEVDPRSHLVVEMRYFGGMTEEEIADLLEISVPTVKRDWRKARAFLFDAIGKPL